MARAKKPKRVLLHRYGLVKVQGGLLWLALEPGVDDEVVDLMWLTVDSVGQVGQDHRGEALFEFSLESARRMKELLQQRWNEIEEQGEDVPYRMFEDLESAVDVLESVCHRADPPPINSRLAPRMPWE